MFYKPVYCCDCGEKIERLSDSLLSISKFCEVCKPHHKFETYAPRCIVCIGILGTIFGFGSFLQKPNQQVIAFKKSEISTIAPVAPVAKQPVAPSLKSEKASVKVEEVKIGTNQEVQTFDIKTAPLAKEIVENTSSEPVYFCGVKTKKGTPCSRKVKGAVRCWQHLGQTAMLPQNKLIASQ